MRRLLAFILIALLLAACSVPQPGVYEVTGSCIADPLTGADCTNVSARPYVAPTPYPPTSGTLTLGASFDPYLQPGVDIVWSVTQSPGRFELFDYDRSVVLVASTPGDYLVEASWVFQGIDYRAPFTLTVTIP